MLHNLKYLPRDTSIEAARVMYSVLRRQSPATRFRLTAELHQLEEALRLAGLRQAHPEYTPDQLRLALIRDRLGKRDFAKAFPDARLPE